MSEQSMAVATGVPEIQVGSNSVLTGQKVPDGFSGKNEDFAKDMAAIAAELGQPAQPESAPAVATPTPVTVAPQAPAPVTPPAVVPAVAQVPAAQTPAIPEKFQTPDGKLAEEKIIKSYLELERKFKQGQSQAPQAPQSQPTVPQTQGQPQQVQASPFELQVAQDLINQSAAQGQPMPAAYALAQARVMIGLSEAKHRADTNATFSRVAGLEQQLEERSRRDELSNLAQAHPWVLTPEGQEALKLAREENPWLNNSPYPWQAATYHVLGQKSLQASPSVLPTPTGVQQSAPQLPVTPAAIPQQPVKLDTPEAVQAHLKTLTPQQENEFWAKYGLPGFKDKGVKMSGFF